MRIDGIQILGKNYTICIDIYIIILLKLPISSLPSQFAKIKQMKSEVVINYLTFIT